MAINFYSTKTNIQRMEFDDGINNFSILITPCKNVNDDEYEYTEDLNNVSALIVSSHTIYNEYKTLGNIITDFDHAKVCSTALKEKYVYYINHKSKDGLMEDIIDALNTVFDSCIDYISMHECANLIINIVLPDFANFIYNNIIDNKDK